MRVANLEIQNLFSKDIQGPRSAAFITIDCFRDIELRVSVAMRACVLLGLVAGATAFTGPSPIGEKLM